jgi:hypothetical protein
MLRARVVSASLVSLFALLAACVGSTGGDVIDFPAAAAGPKDADGAPLEFQTDRGWHVVLTKAKLHVGAIYLSSSQPVSGAQVTACVLPGAYVAEITSGLDVDLLSPAPQRFPTRSSVRSGSPADRSTSRPTRPRSSRSPAPRRAAATSAPSLPTSRSRTTA